uniref:Uncharacterized protein n=1 Tax=Anguilla anguilla TaxID=7936 RepID=A0A0E9VK19_ANGAN
MKAKFTGACSHRSLHFFSLGLTNKVISFIKV